MTVPTLPMGPEAPWLAPLAGFSDLPFRLLCRHYGAAVAVTEMVSAKGLLYEHRGGGGASGALLATCPEDQPLVVQLFGAEPELLGQATALLVQQGYQWFDLNCGCSVPKVTKSGSGAALLRDPERLRQCVAAMVAAAGPGRVGAKLRLGWCAAEHCCLQLAPQLADLGVGWLTLHPRTARQGFGGTADWDMLAAFVRASPVPVLASGDLFDAAAARDCLARSGAAGVMFGRGALADPAVFAAFLQGQPRPLSGPSLAELIRRHAELIRRYGRPDHDLARMRTIVPRYVRHLPGAAALRSRLTRLESWEELQNILSDLEALQHPA